MLVRFLNLLYNSTIYTLGIMVELTNSKREYLQAAYTPIKPRGGSPAVAPIPAPKRAWEKWNFIASLNPSLTELEQLKKNLKGSSKKPGLSDSLNKDVLKCIKTIESTIPQIGTPNAIRSVVLFPEIKVDTLTSIADSVLELRQTEADSAIKGSTSILEAYNKAKPLVQQLGKKSQYHVPAGWKQVDAHLISNLKGATVYHFDKKEQSAPSKVIGGVRGGSNSGATTTIGQKHTMAAMIVPSQKPEEAPKTLIPPVTPTDINIKTLINWALNNNVQPDLASNILNLTKNLPLSADVMTVDHFTNLTAGYMDHLHNLKDAFLQRMAIEPVGFLHLERLGFTPAGIEQGELLHSVPLSPNEEVNITHKEWSNTSEEFQQIVTDFQENYSEQGVAEKSELAQSSQSQHQHSSGLNTAVTASGSYGPVSVTASFGYNMADSASRSENFSRTNSATVTRKASSRVKQEHKMSFKVASASGTEDQAVRKIKNPFTDRATRVDYYELVRKWKVDLYRYGIRLTYDITIPEPGSEILSKIEEIYNITQQLALGPPPLVDPSKPATDPPTILTPTDITRDNYVFLATQYNTAVEPPPAEHKYIQSHDEHNWDTYDNSHAQYFGIEIDVDENYYVSTAAVTTNYVDWKKQPNRFFTVYSEGPDPSTGIDSVLNLLGKSGKLSVEYGQGGNAAVEVYVDLTLNLKDEVFAAWQLKTRSAIYDAAHSQYEANRQFLEKRLADLKGELGVDDPLSLRKIEREEVMKNLLRWLFGPSFTFVPTGLPTNLYDANESVLDQNTWSLVTFQGEIIKFLHHAIEWENMLYFIYPYFWSMPLRWELKKYLEHPDILHKEFLKSGSARVVLTIRPGFEVSFVSFLESGSLLPGQTTPYISIAQEMENYAKTNYPGIPPANPVEQARPQLTPKQRKTWEDMQTIMKVLNDYFKANGSYPTTAQWPAALQALAPPGGLPLVDQWGNNFVYTSPGDHGNGDYDLASYGKDGVPGEVPALNPDGTPNENADITNWAEASLIGTWYEYTPTNAMDIKFNEILPSA